MCSRDYLEIREEKLIKLKQYHASYLKAYEEDLDKKNLPNKEELLEKKRASFIKKEEKYQQNSVKRNRVVKKRVWEIDFFKATVIFFMLVDHLIQDFSMFFPKLFNSDQYLAVPFFSMMKEFAAGHMGDPTRIVFRFIGIAVLAILIGINTRFSKNNWTRFLFLFIAAALLNVFYVIAKSLGIFNYVIMNILMAYALSFLIYCIFETCFKRFAKAWKWILLGTAITFLVGWYFIRFNTLEVPAGEVVPSGSDYFWRIYNSECYHHSYSSIDELKFGSLLEVILGISGFGTEHIGLFPTVGFVFLGAFIGEVVYKDKKSLLRFFDKEGKVTVNEKMNRITTPYIYLSYKSLWFYLLHQPVFTVLMLIIAGLFMGIPLAL